MISKNFSMGVWLCLYLSQSHSSDTTVVVTAELWTHFWKFCLIFLLGLMPGFGQPLEDSSNCTYLLIVPRFILQLLIKTTEIMLAKPYQKRQVRIWIHPYAF
jgi:hypothetical protein